MLKTAEAAAAATAGVTRVHPRERFEFISSGVQFQHALVHWSEADRGARERLIEVLGPARVTLRKTTASVKSPIYNLSAAREAATTSNRGG